MAILQTCLNNKTENFQGVGVQVEKYVPWQIFLLEVYFCYGLRNELAFFFLKFF